MRNAMWVGGGITGMGEIPMLGVKEKGIAKVIRDIFRNGEQGFFYDPSDMGSLFQGVAETTAVSASGQPVGLMLDKSKGSVLGNDSVVNGEFDSTNNWVLSSGHSIAAGKLSFNNTPTVVKSVQHFVSGCFYEVEVSIESITAGRFRASFFGATPAYVTTAGVHKFICYAFESRDSAVYLGSGGVTLTATIDYVKVRQIEGNHTYQATSAARPILKQTPILGNELVASEDFSNGTLYPFDSLTFSNGGFSAKTNTSKIGGVVSNTVFNVTAGVTYVIEFDLISSLDGRVLSVRLVSDKSGAGSGGNLGTSTSKLGKNIINYTPSVSGPFYLQFNNGGAAVCDYRVENISMKEIVGYHTDQNHIAFDSVDDKLLTNLSAPLVNATVLRAIPNVGTQVKYNQTLPMLYEDATPHAGLIAIDRALTRQEQLRLMTELDKKAGATSLETLAFKAFDNNQVGFVYDPNDLSTMFQDANGLKRVTQLGEPVGLILDKSKPNGRELAVNGSFKDGTNGWSLSGTANLTPQGVRITGFGPDGVLSQSVTCEVGKTYLLTAKVSIAKGGITNSTGTASQFFGTRVMTATSTSPSLHFRCYGSTAEADFTITDISFCEISSNNAYQATSASRPILRQNAVTGANYLEFDGTDDYLQVDNTALPTPFTTLFAVDQRGGVYRVLLSAGTGGYINLTSNGVGTGGNTIINRKTPKDVIAFRFVDDNIILRTSVAEGTAKLSNTFATATTKYIGMYRPEGLTKFEGNIYGVVAIAKDMDVSEENNFRSLFNTRLGN